MGIDLIGLMPWGPVKLDRAKRTEAIERAKRVIELVLALNKIVEERGQALPEAEAQEHLPEDTPEWIKEEVEQWGLDKLPEPLYLDTVESFVDEFLDFWDDPSGRDVVSRIAGKPGSKRYQVIFCGGDSFGEEPSGTGYDMLKTATRLGLYEVFGIE